jgi:hypothetical protein
MSSSFYMDVHVRKAVTDGLRLRGADVLTAQEDGAAEFGGCGALKQGHETRSSSL